MTIRLSAHITLDDLATGIIVSHEQALDDGGYAYTFEWQGSPFARIARNIWGRLNPDCGGRHLNRARIGPWDLTLVEDDPYMPFETWYREPAAPVIGFYGKAVD